MSLEGPLDRVIVRCRTVPRSEQLTEAPSHSGGRIAGEKLVLPGPPVRRCLPDRESARDLVDVEHPGNGARCHLLD